MGNQPMTIPLPACCQQVLPVLNDKQSTSSLFEEDAMRLHKSKEVSIYTKEDHEHAMIYHLESESSDADTDCTLSRSLLLEQSYTVLADHALQDAVVEIENKLKQEQQEKDILKHENKTLRKTLSALYKKYGITDANHAVDITDSGLSIDADVTSNYNWSMSPRSESIGYTTSSTLSTDADAAEEAHSVDECISLKRIIDALQWYSTHGNDHEAVWSRSKKYGKQIANDYEHLMQHHLEQNDNVDREYTLICDKINRSVQQCTFEQCNGYRRYLRSRNCDNNNANKHQPQTPKQHQLQTYVNTMDGIHCCFMHLAKSLQFKQ